MRNQPDDDQEPTKDGQANPTDKEAASLPVTPFDDGLSPLLEERVLSELLAARKQPEGLTEGLMARLPTLTALLGDGDPKAALDDLVRNVLAHSQETDDALAVTAAAYSLGLTRELDSRANTHLARLEAFGAAYGFEQRQARRHSDNGLRELTKLITSHFTTRTQPRLDLVIVTSQRDSGDAVTVFIDLHTHPAAPMRPPRLGIRLDDQPSGEVALRFVPSLSKTDQTPGWSHQTLDRPLTVPLSQAVRLSLRWGPLWPQLTVMVTGERSNQFDVVTEVVGRRVGVGVMRRDSTD
ncbi:MAG: hypothetical protein LBK28_02060 [Propionibacteriaceae bacterium]|jgi:hypothetical protein|nr:hypothetical protein [Propionibacteriaceae bacterium]